MAFKAPVTTRRSAARRNLLESLENRQLMAVTAASINFQPAGTSTPSGFIADTGKSFTSQNGLQYGWNTNNSSWTRDRKTSASTEQDTLAHFGQSGAASKWEVAVPNGTYSVTITAGDASYTDSKYGIAAEGKTVVSSKPSNNNRWTTATATVTVTDGRLTITGASGSQNNKINSIKFAPANSQGTPSTTDWASAQSVTTANINFQPSGTSTPGGFVADTGKSFTSQNGLQYGWNTNNTSWTRDRKTSASTEQDTLAHFGQSGAASKWEIAVPNGTYSVTITAGDASYTDSKYGINVENTKVLSFTPSNNSHWGTATGTVKVTDGRLTVSGASGSVNNKINSIKIKLATASGQGVSAPDAPSWVGADADDSDSATITWGDVSNETGYIIEKSTNGGSSWSEAGRVGGGVTRFTETGLSASTTYTFRVKAYNSAGTSGPSVYQTIKTDAAPSNNGGSSNSGGSVSIPNGNSLSGVSVNGGDVGDFKNALNDIGIKNVRLWYNVDWNSTSVDGWYAQRAAAYKAAGFKVMMVVMQERPTDYNTAKAFYTRLANSSGLRNTVDYWQIDNEPNMSQFWSGTASQYVNTNLKPAYEALHAKGETVVGAGPSWDVNYAKTLAAAGYSKYCDYAAFHPYADSAAQVISEASGAKAAFGNKPIMFTEWNISGHAGNTSGWITELNKAAAGLSKIGALSYYFGMEVSSTHVGGGGLLNTNGSHNTPFYNAMKDWLN